MRGNLVSLSSSLFSNAERKIVGIYACAYLLPILVLLIGRIPISDSNIASLTLPFSLYVAFLPLSIVFFVPFLSLLPLSSHPLSSVGEPLSSIGWFVFYGSILFYPVVSYYLLRGSQIAWILSFVSSFATIGLHIYILSTNRWTMLLPFWSLFGILVNCFVLRLLYSCKTGFSV
jgi:hypothetical protein